MLNIHIGLQARKKKITDYNFIQRVGSDEIFQPMETKCGSRDKGVQIKRAKAATAFKRCIINSFFQVMSKCFQKLETNFLKIISM